MISFDSEKCMENFLIENIDHYREEFGIENAEIFQQLNLGAYGIADFVACTLHELPNNVKIAEVVIFELKNTPLSVAHVCQISRCKEFFDKFYQYTNTQVDVRGVLIGKKTFPTSDDLCFLCQRIEWLSTFELDICPFNGVVFRHIQGWRPSNERSLDFKKVIFQLGIEECDSDSDGAANDSQELQLAGIAE